VWVQIPWWVCENLSEVYAKCSGMCSSSKLPRSPQRCVSAVCPPPSQNVLAFIRSFYCLLNTKMPSWSWTPPRWDQHLNPCTQQNRCPPQSRRLFAILGGPEQGKRQRKDEFLTSFLPHQAGTPHLISFPQPGIDAIGMNYPPPAFLGLQLADDRLQDLSTSIWVSSHSQSCYTSLQKCD
jgi:hypothetical protein